MTEPTQLPEVGGHVTPGRIVELMNAMPVGTVIRATHNPDGSDEPDELHWTKEEGGTWRCWENGPWIHGTPDHFSHHGSLYVQSYPEPEALDWVPIPSEAIMAGMTVKLSTSTRVCYIHAVEGRDAYGVYKDRNDTEWHGNNGQLARFRLVRESEWGIVANPDAHIAEEVSRRIAEPIEQLPFDITSRDDLSQATGGIIRVDSISVGPAVAQVGPPGAIYTQEDVDRMIAEARAQWSAEWLADLARYVDHRAE